jgi:hypothetical protein
MLNSLHFSCLSVKAIIVGKNKTLFLNLRKSSLNISLKKKLRCLHKRE